MKTKLLCLCMMSALLGCLHHAGAQSFALASANGVGNLPSSVTTADVNGDGKPDLISANSGDTTLSVLTNDGTGNFTLASSPNAGTGNNPICVTTADVNGDGKPDLICANNNYFPGTLTVFTNDGSGGFVIASSLNVGNGPCSVTAANINGDNKPDLICANAGDGTLTVLTNDGGGGFPHADTYGTGSGSGSYPQSVTTADANGDNKLDLICANAEDATLSVLTNKGNGTFATAGNFPTGGDSFPQSVVAADVNGDGKVDLISANSDYNGTLSVLTNKGNGIFVFASSPNVGGFNTYPYSVAAADVNGDGKVDLISANAGSGTLSVLANDGTGNFTLAALPTAGNNPESVIAVDVNGDGRLDLASANQSDNQVAVLFNGPVLDIKRADSSVVVSWLSIWTGWTLQQNPDLTTANWSASDGVSNDGTNKSLTITEPMGNLFFRLSSP
jgi:hypothetical protein